MSKRESHDQKRRRKLKERQTRREAPLTRGQTESLSTHEGRLALLQRLMRMADPVEVRKGLELAKTDGENHPVLWFFPDGEEDLLIPSRRHLLDHLRARGNLSQRLCDVLSRDAHPPGTVFDYLEGPGGEYTLTHALL